MYNTYFSLPFSRTPYCSPGWHWTQQSSHLHPPSAGLYHSGIKTFGFIKLNRETQKFTLGIQNMAREQIPSLSCHPTKARRACEKPEWDQGSNSKDALTRCCCDPVCSRGSCPSVGKGFPTNYSGNIFLLSIEAHTAVRPIFISMYKPT